jgi:hypothetical protein
MAEGVVKKLPENFQRFALGVKRICRSSKTSQRRSRPATSWRSLGGPIQFFSIRFASKVARDEEGTILPNIDAARREASLSLADLARDTLRSEGSPSLVIEVRTSDGPVFEAAFQWSLGPSVEAASVAGFHRV